MKTLCFVVTVICINIFNGTLNLVSGRTFVKEKKNDVPRIVGRTRVTNRAEFPWLVRLEIAENDGVHITDTICGGALIKMNLVLTAANCLDLNITAHDITVVAGDLDRFDENERMEQKLRGKRFVIHPMYYEGHADRLANNIALILLEKNFTTSSVVNTIKVENNFDLSQSTFGTVAGWGKLTQNSTAESRYLTKVNVPINNEKFNDLVIDRKFQFCAGDKDEYTCEGDAGGPLVCNNVPGTICGIVSYGPGCGKSGRELHPDVYTHVPSYVDWINNNSNLGSDDDLGSNSFDWPSLFEELENNFTTSSVGTTINVENNFLSSQSAFGTIPGWGGLTENSTASRYLMKVNVSINNQPICNKLAINRKFQFCAGDKDKDACAGDLGGPLVCNNVPGTICRIVSYGSGCGREGLPVVYTHVP